MSDQETGWKFAEDVVVEDEHIALARQHSRELGIEAVSPAVGSQLSLLAATTRATSVIEIGTGAGVSGLCIFRGAPNAILTSIDSEFDHQQAAREILADAEVPANRVRLITGRALDVLPRMSDASYDLVLVDGDPAQVIEYVEHGLRLARTGGLVLVPHALWRGRVQNPAARDAQTTAFRTLVRETSGSGAVVAALSPAGDGLLQIAKTGR